MREFCPSDYGSVLEPLVSGDRCRVLTNGRPDEPMRGVLQAATIETAFGHLTGARGTVPFYSDDSAKGDSPRLDREMAAACLAGAWLVHDFLDESHAVSQNIDTPTGAFWHGVMHRREGDFSNSKYWFRRVGDHETFASLGECVVALGEELAQAELARRLAPSGSLDPMALVDACQAAVRSSGVGVDFLRRVQQAEWESLFDYCYRRATAG